MNECDEWNEWDECEECEEWDEWFLIGFVSERIKRDEGPAPGST